MATDDKTAVIVRLDISPSCHPDTLRGDDPGTVCGRNALEQLYKSIGQINDTAVKITDKGRLATAAQPFAERALNVAGRSLETLRSQIKKLDLEIGEMLVVPVDHSLQTEIRGHYKTAKSVLVDVKKAIDDGDIVSVSTVLRAPYFLSGLTSKNHALLRVMAAAKFAPAQVAHRDAAVTALAKVEASVEWYTDTVATKIRGWADLDAVILNEELR